MIFGIVYVIATVVAGIYNPENKFQEISVLLSVFGGVAFWFWTIYDLLKKSNLPKESKRNWLVSMVAITYIANIFYFLMVYVPRNKKIK